MSKLRPHQAAGILISLLGMVVMTGWWTQQPMLTRILPGFLPMVFNAAVCFFFAGVALMLPEWPPGIRKQGQQAVGMLILCVAGLTGLENLVNKNLEIDQLVATLWFYDGNPHPGRMAPLTSLGFILSAGCFLFMHRLGSSKTAQVALQILTHLILAVGIFGLIGYPLKLDLLYDWYRYARMAPHTAIGFIVLGGALWFAWFQTLKQSGVYDKREDRRIAALATLILFLLALIGGLTGFVLSAQRTEASLKQNLESALANRTQFLEFVIGDGIRLAASIATDPALLESLQAVNTKLPAQRSLAPGQMEEHLLSGVLTGAIVLSPDGATVLQAGSFESQWPMALPLREGAVLLWNGHTNLEARSPIMQNGKHLGTLVIQRELPAIDKLLNDARLLGSTGDIAICASLSREEMRCLPSRLVPRGYLHVKRSVNGNPWPASRALDGQSGVAAVSDGRGERVVAASRRGGQAGYD